MAHDNDEALDFKVGDVKTLHHTLSLTHHLTLALIALNAAEGTADFELHNPDAEPDVMVGGLIAANAQDVERGNRRRDDLRLPEKAVPIDTSTAAVEVIRGKLGEKLQIGDRVWSISEISSEGVTLTPGHDYEAHTFLNTLTGEPYQPEALAAEERLGEIDSAL
ncbi:MAG: hypothetical protein JWQ32_597 [Marmoricola sp.]|nr:hypothetical protein [Marmoricola sp.]